VVGLEIDLEDGCRSGVANGGFDGFLQSFCVTAGDVHFGSIALERLGDDEAQARATFEDSQYEMIE
jgi:hypothetical protein